METRLDTEERVQKAGRRAGSTVRLAAEAADSTEKERVRKEGNEDGGATLDAWMTKAAHRMCLTEKEVLSGVHRPYSSDRSMRRCALEQRL